MHLLTGWKPIGLKLKLKREFTIYNTLFFIGMPFYLTFYPHISSLVNVIRISFFTHFGTLPLFLPNNGEGRPGNNFKKKL
jgi:hypothetical protein